MIPNFLCQLVFFHFWFVWKIGVCEKIQRKKCFHAPGIVVFCCHYQETLSMHQANLESIETHMLMLVWLSLRIWNI